MSQSLRRFGFSYINKPKSLSVNVNCLQLPLVLTATKSLFKRLPLSLKCAV